MTGQEWAAVLGIVGVALQAGGLVWALRWFSSRQFARNATVDGNLTIEEQRYERNRDAVDQLWDQVRYIRKQPGVRIAVLGTVVLVVAAIVQAVAVF